jgi:DNA-binding beta-propeller fold protein YncE
MTSLERCISRIALPFFGIAALAMWQASPAGAGSPTLERVQKIPLSGRPEKKLDHLALDAKRDRLFVANMANRTLDIIDLKQGKLFKSVPDQKGIQGVTYAPDLDRVFVGLGVDGYCNAFDGENYALLKSLPFPTDCDNVRYDPHTGMVYVAHLEKSLGIVDAKTLAVKADLKLPGFPESLTLEKKRPRMYMNTPSPAGVMVFDTEKRELIKTYPLKRASGNYPLALDEPNHRLIIGCRKEPMIVVMDSETGKEITSVPVPRDIDDLFFDAKRKRLYAACGEGFLAVIRQIDADRYETLEKLPTSKLARTCLFDAESSRLSSRCRASAPWKAPRFGFTGCVNDNGP